MWEEIKMAWSSASLNSRKISSTSSRTMGSRPAVASSSSRTSGRWARAAAMASFIRMPRE